MIPKDPLRGLHPEKIKAMCEAYMTPGRGVKEIAKSFGVCADRLRDVVRAEGCKMRGRDFAIRQSRHRMGKRTLGHVFGGMAKDNLVAGPPEIEAAKTVLRRKGRIVFDATVTDGVIGHGFIKCDGRNLTPAELIAMAAT